MDTFTSRSDKVGSCAKASMGRGFTYFALFNNGKCLSSWDASSTYDTYSSLRKTKEYCYYYCYWGCYRRCYSYLTECGTGYGDSTTMNVYSFSSKSHKMCFFSFCLLFLLLLFYFVSNHIEEHTANRQIGLFGEGLERTNPNYMNRNHTIHSITVR